VLNIGKLSPGAGEYYIESVATSAEDYYTGRGESQGRWVGSLARELGLDGAVDPTHFRRLLQGRHPHTGEQLITTQGSAARAANKRSEAPETVSYRLPDEVPTERAAAHLGVSARYLRRLLTEGEHYRQRLTSAGGDEVVPEPTAYLLGTKVPGPKGPIGEAWLVPRSELERFAESRRATKARPGYDLTLRPPKSVSVVWALADDDTRAVIRDAHREAVDEVVRYYETQAVRIRQGSGHRRLVDTAGIVAAAFDHRTSRAGDPLLHTHVVTANLTCTAGADRTDRADGPVQWRAIAGGGLFEHARAAGHLYQAHLRHLLTTRLGVEFTPVVNGWAEIDGVPAEVIQVFSKRREEIEELVAEWGASSGRSAQLATLKSRRAKEYGVEPETLTARWHAEADAAGFGPDQLAACLHRDTRSVELEPDMLFAVLAGPHGLTERSSTFCRTDVIEAIASAAGSVSTASEIEGLADAFLATSHVVPVDRTTPARLPRSLTPRRSTTQHTYTTVELAHLEDAILQWGTSSDPAGTPIPEDVVAHVAGERPELSTEQQAMIHAAATATNLLLPVAGRPGAGKTYATEAVVAAHVVAGVPIIGCAVSAAAAAELEATAGFTRSTGTDATTVARLLHHLSAPTAGLRRGTVIVVDEASMLGTRDLHRLATVAQACGGRVVLVGDPDQHGSVDVGGVFRRLCADRGDQLVTLVENNRQQDHTDRLAIDAYRDGRVDDALATYDTAGKVVRCRTAGECFDAIVADWYAGHLHGEHDPMIAGPNSTRRALNERARTLLKANGELTGAALTVAGREFMVGDQVVARHNNRALHAPGRRDFVKNGSTGVVHALDLDRRQVIVEFTREGRITIPYDYLAAGKLEHGYARTTYGVQGATHGTARYVPTDASSFEGGYVAVTRARHATRIYLVDTTAGHDDPDLTHTPEQPEPFGITDIASALARRRASHMAADLAEHLTAVAATLDTLSLAELTRRRQQLDHRLAAAPAATRQVIGDTEQALDRLRARRHAWHDVLDQTPADEPTVRRATASIGALDRSIDRLDRKLAAAHRQQNAHDQWMADHADLVDEADLLRRAEHARALQARSAALARPPRALLDLIGPEPDSQRDRLTWRRAVEAVGEHHARLDTPPSPSHDPLETLLGPRPADPHLAASHDQARAAIDACLDPAHVQQVAAPELTAGP
jgi:conjugative relaxase-like TrwC/TraI family protein